MSIRDFLVFLAVFGGIPFMLKRPYVGVLYWVWLGLMNPHRLTWGLAYDFPFAQIVALTTLLSVLLTRDERRFKGGVEGGLLLAFALWMCITTPFAFNPNIAVQLLERVLKIQLMVFVALVVLGSKRHLNLLVWIMVFSLGFYGVKGGLFTLRVGGAFRVYGPAWSFIEDNNSLALASVMVIPLMFYLYQTAERRWVKPLLLIAAALTATGALGSQSRGALLALGAMGFFLWLKSPGKIVSGTLMLVAGISLLSFMPESWWSRMGTISTYEQDASAMGRINAWQTAFNIATERLVGGGFELYSYEVFARYAPNPEDVHAAHSIYFQVLGEHGFVGLFLFLLIWWLAWRCANQIKRSAKDQRDWRWAGSLATMIQVSLVGYAVGGAFLSLAYWDLPYYELVILLVTRDLIRRQITKAKEPAGALRALQTSSGKAAIASSGFHRNDIEK